MLLCGCGVVVDIYISFDSGCHTNMDDAATDYHSVSNCNVLPINYKWSIKNFSNFYIPFYRERNVLNTIKSAPFDLTKTVTTKLWFSLVQYAAHNNGPVIEVRFEKAQSSLDQAVKFHYKFTILGSNDEEITTEDWNVKVLDQPTSFHTLGSWNLYYFERFVKDNKFTIAFQLKICDISNSISCKKESATTPSEITAPEASGIGLLPHEELSVVTFIANEDETPAHKLTAKNTVFAAKKTPPSAVEVPSADGFGCILGDKEFSDVTFIAGDKEIPAHKALLAAKSPVFAAMFKSRMKEEQTNRIEIPEKSSVFEELLRFIYAGKIEKQEVYTEDLFVAADKYGIDQLASLCEKKLARKLNASNALQLLVFADFHGAGHLKCEAIDFINSHASEVTKTREWKAVIESKPRLLAELAYSNSTDV